MEAEFSDTDKNRMVDTPAEEIQITVPNFKKEMRKKWEDDENQNPTEFSEIPIPSEERDDDDEVGSQRHEISVASQNETGLNCQESADKINEITSELFLEDVIREDVDTYITVSQQEDNLDLSKAKCKVPYEHNPRPQSSSQEGEFEKESMFQGSTSAEGQLGGNCNRFSIPPTENSALDLLKLLPTGEPSSVQRNSPCNAIQINVLATKEYESDLRSGDNLNPISVEYLGVDSKPISSAEDTLKDNLKSLLCHEVLSTSDHFSSDSSSDERERETSRKILLEALLASNAPSGSSSMSTGDNTGSLEKSCKKWNQLVNSDSSDDSQEAMYVNIECNPAPIETSDEPSKDNLETLPPRSTFQSLAINQCIEFYDGLEKVTMHCLNNHPNSLKASGPPGNNLESSDNTSKSNTSRSVCSPQLKLTDKSESPPVKIPRISESLESDIVDEESRFILKPGESSCENSELEPFDELESLGFKIPQTRDPRI